MEPIVKQPLRFIVDDQRHCARMGSFSTFDDARLAIIGYLLNGWNHSPNRAPCGNWRNCGRNYHIIETDESNQFVRTTLIAKIDCDGPIWLFDDGGAVADSG